VPLLEASSLGTQVSLLATMLATGWLVAQVTRRRDGIGLVLGAVGACAVIQALIAIWQIYYDVSGVTELVFSSPADVDTPDALEELRG